jgi:hypothetical protein
MNQHVYMTVDGETFEAALLDERAPRSCAWFCSILPWEQQLVHVRWSGEACWIPLGSLKLDVGMEDATCYPAAGEILLYPGGASETEILLPYGATRFYSKAGALAGNPILQLRGDLTRWRKIAKDTLLSGAKQIGFRLG